MIQIPNKISATTLFFPVNIDKNAGSYVLTLKTESYENTFTKSIQDIGNSSKYIKATVDFSDIPDGEYGYTIDYNGITYSDGLICIGDYEDGEIQYDYSATFYEYDPEKGEGAVVNPLNLASLMVSYSGNSIYAINTPQGYDGIKDVQVKVNVNSGSVIYNQTKSISITANGQSVVNYDSGYTGLEQVNVSVNVPYNSQNKAITATSNGNYTITPDSGYNGLNKAEISVNVPTPTGTKSITANGTYDVTNYASANVNVPIPSYNSQSKNYSITANGNTNITVDSGYDGITGGTISVNVPTPSINLQTKNVTLSQTGYTVTADSGYDGLERVNINAENVRLIGYGEGETAQKAKLVSTAITSNGTYTKEDGYNSVVVNCPTPKQEEAYATAITANGSYSITPTSNKVITGGTISVNVPAPSISLQAKSISLTALSETVTADSGYDGLSQVDIDAKDIYDEGYADAQAAMAPTAITSNGTYSRVDGYSEVTVNCPTPKEEETYTATINANGTHTITPTANKVITGGTITVNVPTTQVVTLTQAQYDALTVKDNNTIYLING